MRKQTVIPIILGILLVLAGCASKSTQSTQSTSSSSDRSYESVEEAPEKNSDTQNSALNVTMLKEISFSENANVRTAVRDECQLQQKVPRFVKQFGQHNNINVTLVDSLSDVETSHVLDVAITHVHAPSGGGYSGAKWMAVDATLRKDGNVVGTAQSKRFSTGGMFSAYKSTCAIVGRCAKTIGQDLAGWLTNPRKGARLGDY